MRARALLLLAAIGLTLMSWSRTVSSPWQPDLPTALARARSQEQLVLVHLARLDRPLSLEMERETFSHPDVRRRLRDSFLPVRLDASTQAALASRAFCSPEGVGTCLLDGEGALVASLPGYASSDDMTAFLDRARRYREPLHEARKLCRERPADPGARLSLGELQLLLGSIPQARACFEQALELAARASPRTPDVLVAEARARERLARVLAGTGRCKEARELLAACLGAGDPSSHRFADPPESIRISEALVLLAERRTAEALRALERVLLDRPSGREADLALLLLARGRHECRDDAGALHALARLQREHSDSSLRSEARALLAHVQDPPRNSPTAHQH